jgi:hypothetical protein
LNTDGEEVSVMDPTQDSTVASQSVGLEQPYLPKRGSRKSLIIGIILGALALLFLVFVVLWLLVAGQERQQIDLVEEALATLAAGNSLPSEMVCVDPDDVVGRLEDPRSWPVESYEVLGVSPLTPVDPVSLWYVDVIVNDKRWVIEVWDSSAGRMAGICGITAHPAR